MSKHTASSDFSFQEILYSFFHSFFFLFVFFCCMFWVRIECGGKFEKKRIQCFSYSLISIVTFIELGLKKRVLMFYHILRCDWWFTSYEWNANNSVRAHSNTTHWQANRACCFCVVFFLYSLCFRFTLRCLRKWRGEKRTQWFTY